MLAVLSLKPHNHSVVVSMFFVNVQASTHSFNDKPRFINAGNSALVSLDKKSSWTSNTPLTLASSFKSSSVNSTTLNINRTKSMPLVYNKNRIKNHKIRATARTVTYLYVFEQNLVTTKRKYAFRA